MQLSAILNLLRELKLKVVFNTPDNIRGKSESDGKQIRQMAITNNIPCFTRVENIISVIESLMVATHGNMQPICLQELKHELPS